MKNHKRYTSALVVAGLALLLSVPASFAQSGQLRAEIPFDFYVGGKLMPAGTYSVAAISSGSVIRVWNGSGDSVIVGTFASTNREPASSRLVFHRFGGASFLSELYWQGYFNGQALPISELEKEAGNRNAPTRFQVATKK